MKSQISPQDYEQISAFLDGELKGAAARNFEARLQKESELRAALQEIQAIRSLVREMPRLRAPHAFTLSPQMVKARKPGFFTLAAFRTMQVSAALSGILLVIILAGDLILSRFTAQPSFAPQAPAAAIQLEAAPALEEIPSEQINATDMGVDAEEVGRDRGTAPTATMAEILPAAPAVPKMLATMEMEMFEATPPGGAPQQAPLPTPLSAPLTAPLSTPSSTVPPPTETVQATPMLSKDEADTGPIPAISPVTARPAAFPYRSMARLIEILLAAVMVISALFALLIRRSLPKK